MNSSVKRILSLTKRTLFLQMKDKGRRFSRPSFALQMMPRGEHAMHVGLEDAVRVGYTVTKQQGNSVVRNRIKRRLRAAVAQLFITQAKAGCDYVVIGREKAARCDFSEILKDLQFALDKIHAGSIKPTTSIKTQNPPEPV